MRLFTDKAGATTISRNPRGGRGVALLMVLTAVAVLTAVSVDFAYNTRVDASLAVNARDGLRAEYLARSALAFGRLVLSFQNQLDTQMGAMKGLANNAASQAGGGAAGAAVAQAMGGALGGIGNIRLWDVLPVDSGAISTFVGAAAAPKAEGDAAPLPEAGADAEPGKAVPATGLLSFGTFDGGFHADIQDEETKLNLNRLDGIATMTRITAEQIFALWADPRWDFLFDTENALHERYSRLDLLAHLHDYIDEDQVETTVNQTAGLGGTAGATGDVFVAGFADEEGPYSRYEPKLKPKNAPFDSLGEVYQVAGVTDRFMAAFADRCTVYPDKNAPLNVNTHDPLMQLANIQAAARDPNQPALRDPTVIKTIFDQLELLRSLGPFMGITVQQFAQVIQGAGIPVKPDILNNSAQNAYLGDKSQTFTIRATGQAGEVERTLTAVVRYDQGLGKLLYFREE
jgi:general secretion pathway protein K